MGILDNILAMVNAVATSPSSSILSKEPVGKNGNTNVKEATKSLGSANMTESCSKITAGELNDARKATCWPLMFCTLFINRFGKPSSKLLKNHTSIFMNTYPNKMQSIKL